MRLPTGTILALALSSTLAEGATERKGIPITLPEDSPLNGKQLTQELISGEKAVDLRKMPSAPFKPAFDSSTFRSDTSGFGTPCFTNVGPWIPADRDAAIESEFQRTMTCESRDSLVKAFAFTSVFLKGTSYVCVFTPLPQAQIAAKVFDIASYASSTVGLVVSAMNCENKLEQKFNALLKTCEELKKMGIDCQGVDDSPF